MENTGNHDAEQELAELSRALLEVQRTLRSLCVDEAVRAGLNRRILAVTNVAKRDAKRALERVNALRDEISGLSR